MSFVGATIALIVVYAAARYGLFRLRDFVGRSEARSSNSACFFDAAQALINDADTPAEVLEVLEAMNETLSDPNGPAILMGWLMQGKLTSREEGQIADEVKIFFAKRQELERQFFKALRHWFLSISYRSWWRGPVLRSLLNEDKLAAAPKRVKAAGRSRHAHGVPVSHPA